MILLRRHVRNHVATLPGRIRGNCINDAALHLHLVAEQCAVTLPHQCRRPGLKMLVNHQQNLERVRTTLEGLELDNARLVAQHVRRNSAVTQTPIRQHDEARNLAAGQVQQRQRQPAAARAGR